MRLILNIKRTPAKAASMKMAHFSNIGVLEVFLEATPTTFITTALFFKDKTTWRETGLHDILLGKSEFTRILFYVGYAASILSSAFGVSR